MVENKKKILIIEDEGDLNTLLTHRLQSVGFLVDVALDGKTGLSKAKSFSPDAILLDVMMPEMDGWEVCRRLRQDGVRKDVPVVIFTVLEKQKAEKGAKECGASHVILKPFDKEEIIQVLKEVTNKS